MARGRLDAALGRMLDALDAARVYARRRGRSWLIWRVAVPYFTLARGIWTVVEDGLLAPTFSWPVVLSELAWDAGVGGLVFGYAVGLWIWYAFGVHRATRAGQP